MDPQVIGSREYWLLLGAYPGGIHTFADKIRPLNEHVAEQLLDITECNSRLSVENHEIHSRAMPLEEWRLRYFVTNWPEASP